MQIYQENLHIAGISDTHFDPSSTGFFSKEEYIEHVQDMGNADIIVHCGDFTDRGSAEGAKIAAEVFRNSKIPVVGILGNHDFVKNDSDQVRKILEEEGGITILNGEHFDLRKADEIITFVGVTGFVGQHKDKMTRELKITKDEYEDMASEQFKNFASTVSELEGKNNIGLVHFQPVRNPKPRKDGKQGGSLRSSNYGDLFDKHRDNFSLVLHGHDHYGNNSANRTIHGVNLENVATPVTITLTPGKPYRLIEVEIRPNYFYFLSNTQ